MLDDQQFIMQSISSNLFYLRTIREFCANIQLSFLKNNESFATRAADLAKRCEDVGEVLVANANGNITQRAIDLEIYVTEFTLPCELLTEKLFPIEINTEITEQELKFTPGNGANVTPQLVEIITDVNVKSREITLEFIRLCGDIYPLLRSNQLFSYSYPSIYLYMIEESGLYLQNLERLLARDPVDPIFAINYEYWFHIAMRAIATFLRGLIDPADNQTLVRAEGFIFEFDALIDQYQTAPSNPDTQRELTQKSLDIIKRFQIFLKETIQNLLNQKVYFIVEPIFLDNMYTEANYFRFVLEESQLKQSEENTVIEQYLK